MYGLKKIDLEVRAPRSNGPTRDDRPGLRLGPERRRQTSHRKSPPMHQTVPVLERVRRPGMRSAPHPQLQPLLTRDYAKLHRCVHAQPRLGSASEGFHRHRADLAGPTVDAAGGARRWPRRVLVVGGRRLPPRLHGDLAGATGRIPAAGGHAHGRPQRPSRRPDRRAGRRHQALADQLREAPSRRQQFALLDAYLLRRARTARSPHQRSPGRGGG